MVFRKYHCYGTSGISLFFETKKEDGSEVPSSISLTIKSKIRYPLSGLAKIGETFFIIDADYGKKD